jgi:hypothetical protein
MDVTVFFISRFYRVLMMVHSIQNNCVFNFFHRPVFLGVEIRCFGNWICFGPLVKGGRGKTSTQLGPLDRVCLEIEISYF